MTTAVCLPTNIVGLDVAMINLGKDSQQGKKIRADILVIRTANVPAQRMT